MVRQSTDLCERTSTGNHGFPDLPYVFPSTNSGTETIDTLNVKNTPALLLKRNKMKPMTHTAPRNDLLQRPQKKTIHQSHIPGPESCPVTHEDGMTRRIQPISLKVQGIHTIRCYHATWPMMRLQMGRRPERWTRCATQQLREGKNRGAERLGMGQEFRSMGTTLWWTNSLQWKITILNGKIHYKWPFSIAMLVHQRVNDVDPFLAVNHPMCGSQIWTKIQWHIGDPLLYNH